MDISAQYCPSCRKGGETQLLSTHNEWRYYCKRCNNRFNKDGEIYVSPRANETGKPRTELQ